MNYSYLYKKLNKRTPLLTDCGKLCSNKCCVDEECDGEELGMYLFPGEEEMFFGKENFKISESEFFYGDESSKILFCKPSCKRDERPLSCRIFPLFPYVTKDYRLNVIIDPRAISVCPLSKISINDFSSKFRRGVKHIGRILMAEKKTRDYLFELSRLLDEEIKLFV